MQRRAQFSLATFVMVVGFAQAAPGELSWASMQRTTKVSQANVLPQPVMTAQVVVKVKSGANVLQVANRYGASVDYRFLSSPQWATLRATSVAAATLLATQLSHESDVEFAHQSIAGVQRRDAFVPNDPFYFPNAPAAPWEGQWYLNNTINAGRDLNVIPAWNNDVDGTGVIVGVVDDSLQTAHPDITGRYSLTNSFNFGNNNANVNPVVSGDFHGTPVCGIIAGNGGNGIGITGVAPRATLGVMRLDFDSLAFDTQSADATTYRSSGASVFIKVKNHSYGPAASFINDAAQVAALQSSSSVGTIHVRSAGNYRGTINEDVNRSMVRNIPETITVASLGSNGTAVPTSSFGAMVTCVAPSTDPSVGGLRSFIALDRTGDAGVNSASGDLDAFPDTAYSSRFGGTSAAAPMVAGVLTLTEQVQPSLNVRFAKHLIARTARIVDATDATEESDGGWRTNAAGFSFNQNYGFGLIDAAAMVTEAPKYSGVTPADSVSTSTITTNASIPDNSTGGVSRFFTLNKAGKIEELLVTVNVTHPWRGDLQVEVTSPRGARRRLLLANLGDDGDNLNWTFATNAFWGESPQGGSWILTVSDRGLSDTGTLVSYSATARLGDLIPATTTISGNVDLLELADADPAGQQVTFIVRQGATNTPYNVTLGAGGAYSFAATQVGTADLIVKGRNWLSRKVSAITLNGSAQTRNFSLINGDVDGDDSVSILDYLELSAAFDSQVGDPGYLPRIDLDDDGFVSILDYLILSANYDLIGEDATP
jgi:subtilisin-like proprotein convertase family protein